VSLSAPFPVDTSWRPLVTSVHGAAHVSWPQLHSIGGTMDYLVLRAPAGDPVVCDATSGGAQCRLNALTIDATPGTSYVDEPPAGRWTYRIGAVASWTKDPTAGNIFAVGPPVTINLHP
jgi:hypothetical protein